MTVLRCFHTRVLQKESSVEWHRGTCVKCKLVGMTILKNERSCIRTRKVRLFFVTSLFQWKCIIVKLILYVVLLHHFHPWLKTGAPEKTNHRLIFVRRGNDKESNTHGKLSFLNDAELGLVMNSRLSFMDFWIYSVIDYFTLFDKCPLSKKSWFKKIVIKM